jgi:hypothetical protein
VVKVKENHFKTCCRPAGILPNVKSVIYFKLELKLKFRINEKLLSHNCKSFYRLNPKIHYVEVKI